jgi:hypothetical protein
MWIVATTSWGSETRLSYPVNLCVPCGYRFEPHAPKFPRAIIEVMRKNRLAFAVFAAAIFFSMVREWNAPVACARKILIPTLTAPATR